MIYKITVDRTKSELDFLVSDKSKAGFPTKCWWDPAKKIPANTYNGCSTTYMSSKTDSVTGGKRPAVFIPDVPGFSGIFVHEGTSAAWSDGCIVCARDRVLDIFNTVPRDGRNITLVVSG